MVQLDMELFKREGEEIGDVQSFETHREKIWVYGHHFQERLQQEHTEKSLIGIITNGYEFGGYDYSHVFYPSTFYFVGTEEKSEQLRALVELVRTDNNCYVIIRDPELRNSTEKILKELDEKSGEAYSSNIKHSRPRFIEFEESQLPSSYK